MFALGFVKSEITPFVVIMVSFNLKTKDRICISAVVKSISFKLALALNAISKDCISISAVFK